MAVVRTKQPPDSGAGFCRTRWTVVLAAGTSRSPGADEALDTLCRDYWYPLYAYVRRRGYSRPDAQDLTQEFFAQLIAHHWIARVHRCKGRFRSFLLMTLKRFLANEWDKTKTLKRGGQYRFVPLEFDVAESRYASGAADTFVPEQLFDREWALTLLESALGDLRRDYARDGKAKLFDTLKPCLIGSRELQPYAVLATALGMTEGAVKVAVCRLRERYRTHLRQRIVPTVATPEDVDAELRHLFRVLATHYS